MDEEGRRSRRSTKYSGDFQLTEFSDLDSSGDERIKSSSSKNKSQSKGGRTKECPGCGAVFAVSVKECTYCDYTFTSRSMLVGAQSAVDESRSIRNRFPFEPEREDDGTLKIQFIFGRRLRKNHKRLTSHNKHSNKSFSAVDSKFDYEYLVKYKTMSYLHVQWLSAHEIETMNPRSKQALQRYLNKLDKGDPGAQEDGEFDPSYTEIEKILDCREEDVYETVDETAPEVIEAGAHQEESIELQITKKNTSTTSSTTTTMSTPSKSETNYDDNGEAGVLARSKVWNAAERCKRVLEKLWDDPYGSSFQYPVDTDAYEDYLDIVNEPICLQDVKDRLENGTYKGHTLVARFSADVREIWKNCKVYNLHKSQIWYCAHTLSLMFERLLQAWVLSFQEGLIPLSDPIARPWESTCRICLSEDDEESIMLCDHCDAPYHIYCLKPPLPSIPEDTWLCSYCSSWLKKTGTKCLSASIEDEARQMTDGARERKITKVKRKKYLVKWRGLSYRDCTWESAKDINDDKVIADYHRLNDTPPEEPPLTQAEIGVELSKERKNQKYPAIYAPHALREVDALIYSQIRAMHFLRFNLQPPEALLKECGPSCVSRVYGGKTMMKLPVSVVSSLENAFSISNNNDNLLHDINEEKEEEDGEDDDEDEDNNEENKDDNNDDNAMEIVKNKNNENNIKEKKDEEDEEDEEEEEEEEEDWNTFKQNYIKRVKGMTAEEALEVTEAAFEAKKLARKIDKNLLTPEKKSGPYIRPDLVKQSWFIPPNYDVIRNEVSSAISDILHSISRGNPIVNRSRPPLRSNEIEICIPKGDSGLYMNIGDYKDKVVVLGFRDKENGTKGPVQSTGKVKAGDLLVAVNGYYLTGLEFKDIIKLIGSKEYPYLYLRFLRIPPSAANRIQHFINARGKQLTSSKPIPKRSKYIGVYILSNNTYKAELVKDYNSIVVGVYNNEIEAAKSYDLMLLKLSDNQDDITNLKLNFQYEKIENNNDDNDNNDNNEIKNENSDIEKSKILWKLKLNESGEPILNSIPQLLHKFVEAEEKLTSDRLKKLEDSFEHDMKLRQSEGSIINQREIIGRANSEDTNDSDSELQSSTTNSSNDSDNDHNDDDEDEDDDDDDSLTSEDEEDWDSDKQTADKLWKPKDDFESGDGPFGRLLRAVNEAEYPPIRSEWNNYIIEIGMQSNNNNNNSNNNNTRGDLSNRKIEQVDLASGVVTRVWDSVNAASRSLNIPSYSIQAVLENKVDNGGGFKWRYAPLERKSIKGDNDNNNDNLDNINSSNDSKLSTQDKDVDDEEILIDPKKEEWQTKLYSQSKEYLNGGKLRDYQVDGLNWLLRCWYSKQSSILADEMGLGKTVQVVTFLNHLFEVESIRGPFLVCVPLSTIEHWKRETETWTQMIACLYHDTGGGRDMRDVIREYEWYYKGRSRRLLKFQVLITTYDDLIRDYEELAEIPWRVVVVDEAHRLRNTNSKLLECMRAVVSKGQVAYGYQHRILMTGTPLQNNTAELWSLLNFIEPAKFPDALKFAARYGNMQTQEQVESLQRRIAPHLLRRVKEDVAKDIPPKQETIIDVELTTMQKQYYRAIFEHNHGFLIQSTKGSLPKLMNIQMELRKCCNHPYLITGVEQKEMDDLETNMLNEYELKSSKNDMTSEELFNVKEYESRRILQKLIPVSGKMVLLDKLLPKLQREDHKVLIFSQMVKMIDIIEEFCEFRGYPCERLDGRVQGNDRQKSIDRFNTDSKSFVFLLSTRAGGVGINLTAADTVIIFDSDWNPQNDIQAMARCHRIGQSKNVTVYRLITRKSFESEMFERASKKLGLEQALLGTRTFTDGDPDESSKIDAKEMETLLRQGAYALMMDDDNDIVKEFCEQDIESILDSRAHVRVVEGQQTESWLNKKKKFGRTSKSLFTGESSLETAEIDVNDPDFWKKVLPDLVTPDMMIERLGDLDIPVKKDGRGRKKKKVESDDEDLDRDEEDDEESLLRKSEATAKFMTDMEQMMEGILDLQRRGTLPDRERNTCLKLLLRLTLQRDILEPDQLSLAQEWLTLLEGTRRRGQVQKLDANNGSNSAKKTPNKRGPIGKKGRSSTNGIDSLGTLTNVKGSNKKKRKFGSVDDDDDDDEDNDNDDNNNDDFSDGGYNSNKGSDSERSDNEFQTTPGRGRGRGGGRGSRGGRSGRGGRGRGNNNENNGSIHEEEENLVLVGRGGRGGRGRGRGIGRGRGRGNNSNNDVSDNTNSLGHQSIEHEGITQSTTNHQIHTKSLRALRAAQVTSMSRQLLQESKQLEQINNGVEWENENENENSDDDNNRESNKLVLRLTKSRNTKSRKSSSGKGKGKRKAQELDDDDDNNDNNDDELDEDNKFKNNNNDDNSDFEEIGRGSSKKRKSSKLASVPKSSSKKTSSTPKKSSRRLSSRKNVSNDEFDEDAVNDNDNENNENIDLEENEDDKYVDVRNIDNSGNSNGIRNGNDDENDDDDDELEEDYDPYSTTML